MLPALLTFGTGYLEKPGPVSLMFQQKNYIVYFECDCGGILARYHDGGVGDVNQRFENESPVYICRECGDFLIPDGSCLRCQKNVSETEDFLCASCAQFLDSFAEGVITDDKTNSNVGA